MISDSGNLKFDSEQDIFEHKIDFNIKEPEIYEFCIDTRIEKYNRFINKFYTLGKEENYLNYIQKTLKNKNFFFLMAPRKIEMFASDLYQNISNDIKNDNLIAEVIKSLKKYVHKDFYGIQYLEKGIVYLHGKVPDNIKEYLEFKFQTVPNIRFLVANNVILEGINLPIDNLYILSTHRLSSAKITNLIGRVNRLNMIFDSSNNDFSLLLPTVHFVNTTKYARKNSNMKGKIMQLRTGRFSDIIENPLLDKFDATKLEREDEPDSKQKKTFEKIIEEEKFVLDDNHTSDIHVLKRKMIELGMNTIYDLSDQICELLLSRIKSINSTIEKDFMSVIHKIFVEGLGNSIIDDEFARLKNEFIISHYEHFITSSKKKSLKENINYILSYFEKKRKLGNTLMYIGNSFGDTSYRGESYEGNPVYVDLKGKKHKELVNLAIIKLKLENDFVNYTLIKFFQLMLDYEIISHEKYNTIIYGTNDKNKLSLLKQGLTINIINKLETDNQIKNIHIDENNIVHGTQEFQKYTKTLDDFFKFEIDKHFS
ncbi:helicase C-terminal domain-containing protein [Treponema phagedenis]|uniref:helicase C-terminal domain-containing protein n=1 Tax=Treponema phagedenis TaxID=162 RepID=UPI001CA3E86E|nr:helicase C-terminal domain-containing protein [Treponema phagedenis]